MINIWMNPLLLASTNNSLSLLLCSIDLSDGDLYIMSINNLSLLIVRARDKKLDIIEITEVKPKNSRYKPHLAEYSLTEVGNYKMF
jgi:hypothetical protein